MQRQSIVRVGKHWHFPDGTILPVVAGGSDAGSSGDGDTDTGGDDGDQRQLSSDDKSKAEPDHAAEAAKWKDLARKHEERAKRNANAERELDELKRKNMNEQERAVAEAKEAGKAEGKAEVLTSVGAKLVHAEFRALSAGRLSDEQRSALFDSLDLHRFITDDGEVDTDKVQKIIDGITPATGDGDGANGRRKLDLGQGRRGAGTTQPSVDSGRSLWAERHARKGKTTT